MNIFLKNSTNVLSVYRYRIPCLLFRANKDELDREVSFKLLVSEAPHVLEHKDFFQRK